MQELVEGVMYSSQGEILMFRGGCLVGGGPVPVEWDYLTFWSASTILSLHKSKPYDKTINPKRRR